LRGKSNKSERNHRETYRVPPVAGPIALNRDMPVIAIPLAAPLWCCSCFPNQHVRYATIPSVTTLHNFIESEDKELSKNLPLLGFVE